MPKVGTVVLKSAFAYGVSQFLDRRTKGQEAYGLMETRDNVITCRAPSLLTLKGGGCRPRAAASGSGMGIFAYGMQAGHAVALQGVVVRPQGGRGTGHAAVNTRG